MYGSFSHLFAVKLYRYLKIIEMEKRPGTVHSKSNKFAFLGQFIGISATNLSCANKFLDPIFHKNWGNYVFIQLIISMKWLNPKS